MQILFFCNPTCRIFLRRKSLSFNSVYDWLGFSNQLPEDQSKFHIKPIKGVSRCTRDNLRLRRGSIVSTLTKILSHWGGGGGGGAKKVSVFMGCPYYKRGGRKTGFDCKKVSDLEEWYCTFSDPYLILLYGSIPRQERRRESWVLIGYSIGQDGPFTIST